MAPKKKDIPAHIIPPAPAADPPASPEELGPNLRTQLAGATLVIADQLRAIQKLTDERARNRREDQAEIAYWRGEVERLHNDLLEIHRERARESASCCP